jgi:hypothetical protein
VVDVDEDGAGPIHGVPAERRRGHPRAGAFEELTAERGLDPFQLRRQARLADLEPAGGPADGPRFCHQDHHPQVAQLDVHAL